MAIKWTLNLVILFVALTFASGIPMSRERRFLVENIMNQAKAIADGVSGFFGRQFEVKNVHQALSDSDRLRSYAYNFNKQGMWINYAAASYRKSLYHQDTQAHRDEWKTAATLMTKLADELLLEETTFIRASNIIRLSITARYEIKNVKKRFQAALSYYEGSMQRLEKLLPQVTQALTELKDVVDSDVKKDVVDTLKQITKTDKLVKRVRQTYDSIVLAIGIDS